MLSLFVRKIKDILKFFKTFYSNGAFDTGVPSSGDGTLIHNLTQISIKNKIKLK